MSKDRSTFKSHKDYRTMKKLIERLRVKTKPPLSIRVVGKFNPDVKKQWWEQWEKGARRYLWNHRKSYRRDHP